MMTAPQEPDSAHESGTPGSPGNALCFAIGNWESLALPAPDNRHGQSVRCWARALEGLQTQAIVYSALGECAWQFRSDETQARGGQDQGPCPAALLAAGMIASYMNEILGAAECRDLEVHDLALRQESYYAVQPADSPHGADASALPLELEVRITSSADANELHGILLSALSAAPHYGLLRQTQGALIELSHTESQSVATAAPEGFAPHAAQAFDRLQADEILEEPLIARCPAATDSASGMAPGQSDMRLHGRALCRMRDDGLKEIEHHWLVPRAAHGYRFLSDEPAGFGGRSLAPDASSLMAAGLALSLMAELSRGAARADLSARDLWLQMDLHFPFGGLVQPGISNATMDPVEAQVRVQGRAEDERLRELVRMSERASLGQAVCRDRLITNIRIKPF
jgi:hypothetical protein